MRVLILADNSRDIVGDISFQDEEGFVRASPRRDLVSFVPCLDPARLQIEVYALRGDGDHSLHERHWADFSAWRQLFRLVHEHEIELIHAMGYRAMIYAMAVGRLRDIPTLATLYESWDAHSSDRIIALGMRLARWGINRIIIPCDLFKRSLINLHYPPDQIEVIYPGIDVPDAGQPAPDRAMLGLPDGPLVTAVIPLTTKQGFDVLMDAFARVAQRIPNVHIAVVGAGPLLTELRWQAAKAHAPILWLGEQANLREIIRASDVIVAYPRREGLPQSLVYAAAAGKPAVSVRVGGVTEILEGAKTGSLITPGDSRDLALQIGRYLLQPTWAKTMGQAAFELARTRFSITSQCETMTTLYERTIYASR